MNIPPMDEAQKERPLPFPDLSGDLPLLPARMVNEYQYCPRLAYLEWVQGEWADSSDIVEGRYAHRRVQLCIQGLILEEHGYECGEGALYFAEKR